MEQSEQGETMRRRGQGGDRDRSYRATGRTWAFTPTEVGAPERRGKEGQNLTQVFTGALWWLLHGGQTIGRGGAGGVITLVQVGDVRMD